MQGKFGINIMLVRNKTSGFVGSGKQNKSKKIKGVNIVNKYMLNCLTKYADVF